MCKREEGKIVDIASLVGIVLCFVLIIISIIIGDGSASAVLNFIDAPSALITFGGSFLVFVRIIT